MPAGKERVAEIIDFSMLHGDDSACETYGIDKTTLDRYRRIYKQHFGENADLLMKIKNQYSPEELRFIANGGKSSIQKTDQANIIFDGDEITIGVISDTHFGSIDTDETVMSSIYNEMNKRGCVAILHSGDLSEGMMARPGHVYELCDIGFIKQRDKCIKMMSMWDKEWWIIDGNHDDSFNTKLGAGISMGREIADKLNNVHYLGNGVGEMTINGIRITLYHGNDGGSSYALSYRVQKIIESISSKKKPQILITGHDHKSFYLPMYRNVQGIAGGCIQKQTSFMALHRSAANTGFWIIKFGAKNGSLLWFEPRWFPLYL